MEVAKSKSPLQQEDSQISPEISITLAETVEEFQQCVEDILEEIEQDESFSEMTAENYDNKKSYLTRHLTELSRLYMLLADQHVRLVEEVSKNCPSLIKNQHLDSSDSSSPQVIEMHTPYRRSKKLKLKTPTGFDFVFRASGGGFSTSKREGLESSSSLSSDSGSESTGKLLSSPVEDGALRVIETKSQENESETTSEKSNVVDESVSDRRLLENETTKLKSQENESEITTEKSHLELQKQVDDLKLVISDSDLKIKTLEEELEKSRKSLSIAKETISNLKGEKSSKVFQQNLMMKYELQSGQKLVGMAREQLATQLENYYRIAKEVESCVAPIKVRDGQINKLNTKNDRYKSEILRLEESLKSKDDIWKRDVIKLKVQLKNKSKSFDDLKKQLSTTRSETNRAYGKLETLEEEKCSKDKLIQELETRLNMLQVEHERIVLSFENAEKLNSELTLKMVELEREVDRQREVISVTTEEKIEAIRQLSFSLEHYMSKYKQLHQSHTANKTCCFSFPNCLTQ